MSDDYDQVAAAMARGVTPAQLCSTCPWDRLCVSPPTMTADDVQREIDNAKAMMPTNTDGSPDLAATLIGSLLANAVLGSKNVEARICPVFAARLRSSAGRQIADNLRTTMRSWDDDAVDVASSPSIPGGDGTG